MKVFDNFDKNVEQKLFKEQSEKIDVLNYQSPLFEPHKEFKNKFYFENLTDDCFFDINGAKDEFVRFYKRITKTGVGSIIFGGINLWKNSKEFNNLARIINDERIVSSYKQISLFAHSYNTKVFLKVNAGIGRFYITSQKQLTKYGSNFCLAPKNKQKLVIRASDNKCNELVNEILKVMLLVSISNLDGLMIDASLSNLIGELSSQEFNKRVFGYYSNTNDFLKKALKNINKSDKKIYLKISVLSLFSQDKSDFNLCEKQSFNEEKFFNDLKTYIELGVDGFEFVFGRWENNFLTNFNSFQDELLYDDFVKNFREYLNNNNIKTISGEDVLILYHDNFSNFNTLDNLINEKIVNFVDITKNLYTDNNFLKEIKNAKQVKNCLKCSYCNKISEEKQKIECLINPKLCEFNEPIVLNKSKEVAIVGSGISGLTCAKTLAERGFNVSIFEQEKELNPIGKLTTIFSFDKRLDSYFTLVKEDIDNFVKKNKIKLIHNQKFQVTKESLNQYYSVIVATGFKPKFLSVSGAVQSHVLSLYDALKKEKILLSKKHIVIYAKTILSLKLALYLVEKHKNVTIVIKDIKLLNLNKNADLFYYFYILNKFNVNIYFLSKVIQINEDNIDLIINKNLKPNKIKTMIDIFSNSKLNQEFQLLNIDCDLFIYEPETVPNTSLYAEIVKSGYKGEVYLIGNALENGDLAENIKSGYFVGKNL